MPEGHTIHRLARDLRRDLGAQPLRVSSPQGRFADAAALLDGAELTRTDAHGKHLFVGFGAPGAPGREARWVGWVHVHLGLYGAWVIAHRPEPDPRGALRLRLVGAESYADLRGPTACELITAQEKVAVHARLGPDPLRRDADPARAAVRVMAGRTSIGALLMDQTVIAGIGNVFRAEVLFRHGVHPLRPGRAVEPETWEAMWTDLVALLRAGVRTGRIVTTRPEHRSRRRGPALQEDRFYVYRRAGQPCRVCGTTICSAELVARTVSWCPRCQPS